MFGGLNRKELNLVFLLGLFTAGSLAVYHWRDERPATALVTREVPAAAIVPKAASPPAVIESGAGGADKLSPAQLGQVDINTATEADLELLPLIGPAKARQIIEEREANGPFRSVDELTRVPGIGEKTRDRLREYVVVNQGELPTEVLEHESPLKDQVPAAPAKVRVNHATAEELEDLIGVGPVLAARISLDRKINGPFRTPTDLLRVKGFGPKTLEKNLHLIVID